MASKKTKKNAKRTRKAKSAVKPANSPVTGAALVKGAKFGYRLITGVTSRDVTYVNTNGCKPSDKPAVDHTVSRGEFLDLIN